MNKELRKYFATIGKKGGLRSRRKLDSDTARDMVRIREARRAFKQFYANCFWSFDPKLKIESKDFTWVAKQLMKHGNREAWRKGEKLCH
jgi:hypothetical protein